VWLRQPFADAGLIASSRTAHIPRIRSDTAFHPLEAAVWLDRIARISRIPRSPVTAACRSAKGGVVQGQPARDITL
jgi:hypothetical protein